ncbi:MAG: P-type conjugative transfer protein TrbJ [Rhodospirillales bacterium]|nr:P-type conjugative transfer protein TrbJ [Rhodospirillales bacterium]
MPLSSNGRTLARHLVLGAGVLAFTALAGIAVPSPAQAQWAVACVNCSTTATQLLQYAKEAQSLGTQLQQYQTQLEQYANMVTNTVALPQEVWGTAQSDIMQVQALSNAASLLSGNSGSMISRLQSASAYADQAAGLGNVAGQFTTWQQTIGNNLSTMGQTLGLQQSQQQNQVAILSALQQHAQSAQGQMQAIQAGNELAGANAAQLAQIQATLTATAQMQASSAAVAADRQASEDAAMLHFATPQPVATAGYQQY